MDCLVLLVLLVCVVYLERRVARALSDQMVSAESVERLDQLELMGRLDHREQRDLQVWRVRKEAKANWAIKE